MDQIQEASKKLHMFWYPVPSDDKRTNPNFKKQVIDQPGALEGGDGYTFAN